MIPIWARDIPEMEVVHMRPEWLFNRHVYHPKCGRTNRSDVADIMERATTPDQVEQVTRLATAMTNGSWKVIPNNKLTLIPIIFDQNGLIIEGFHRPFAVSLLWGKVDSVPLVCLFGWPNDLVPWEDKANRFANRAMTQFIDGGLVPCKIS